MFSGEESFSPHFFCSKVKLLPSVEPSLPMIIISRDAFARMCLYVRHSAEEVGWLGSAEQLPNGDFLIEQVFLLDQDVSGVETVLTTEGLSQLAQELIADGDRGMEVLNKLRFWGHSHVFMPTSPSGTDEHTMALGKHGYISSRPGLFCFQESGYSWAIRGIFNKEGRAEFTLFLYEKGLKIEDVPWTVVEPESKELGAAGDGGCAVQLETDGDGEADIEAARNPPDCGQADEFELSQGDDSGSGQVDLDTADPVPERRSDGGETLFGSLFHRRGNHGTRDPKYLPDITDELADEVKRELAAKVRSRRLASNFFGSESPEDRQQREAEAVDDSKLDEGTAYSATGKRNPGGDDARDRSSGNERPAAQPDALPAGRVTQLDDDLLDALQMRPRREQNDWRTRQSPSAEESQRRKKSDKGQTIWEYLWTRLFGS